MIKNYDKVIILTTEDAYITLEAWQKSYGLTVGSDEIGKHFKFTEPKFADDLAQYGKLIVCEPLMKVLDKYRDLVKEAVMINSFNRDEKKQKELRAQGFKAATTSPHVEKMAADVDTQNQKDTFNKVILMEEAALAVQVEIRLGYREYMPLGQSFIHVDVCPMYYGPGKPRENEPHPIQWDKFSTW